MVSVNVKRFSRSKVADTAPPAAAASPVSAVAVPETNTFQLALPPDDDTDDDDVDQHLKTCNVTSGDDDDVDFSDLTRSGFETKLREANAAVDAAAAEAAAMSARKKEEAAAEKEMQENTCDGKEGSRSGKAWRYQKGIGACRRPAG